MDFVLLDCPEWSSRLVTGLWTRINGVQYHMSFCPDIIWWSSRLSRWGGGGVKHTAWGSTVQQKGARPEQ